MTTPRRGRGRQTRRQARRLAYGLGIGSASALILAALSGTGPLRVAEWKSYDARARLVADSSKASSDIVFVDIDSNSLEALRDELGRWPWRRDAHAILLKYLRTGGARAVVFDVSFPEPDRANPAADSAFAETLAEDGGAVLALTFSAGDDRAAIELERTRSAEDPELGRALDLLDGFRLPTADGSALRGPELPYVEAPTAFFLEGADGIGSVNLNADADGVVRWERLVYDRRGEAFPSLALAAARLVDPDRFGGPIAFADGEIRIGERRIPVDEDGRMLLRWRGPYRSAGRTTWPVVPAYHVINSFDQVMSGRTPDVPLETFKDKIVFVAVTGTGTLEFDARPTPLTAVDPGVILHATALDNLLSGDHARRSARGTNLTLLATLGVATGVVTAGLGSGIAASLAFLALMGALTAGTVLALAQGVWIDLVAPSAASALAFAGTMVANYATEGREKRRVRDLFSRYVAPEYVRRLADDFESIELGGERCEITLLFSDIRGFTSLSEKLPAAEVIEILNEYLERMSEVVFRHGGTLDKFIGDAVMAFWGAPVTMPDHARRAVDAALDMVAELEALNRRWAARGLENQLAIGIGLNTGEAVVGNIGSLTRKLDYTAIGDTVNLASRLESLNKDFGTTVLVSETTARAAGAGYRFNPLEAVTVKGKTKAVNVLELVGRALVVAALAFGCLVGRGTDRLEAQQPAPARWSDWVYRPGRWVGSTLTPISTTNQGIDSLALIARVEGYSIAPRWRLEVVTVTSGGLMSAPLVVLGGSGPPVVQTDLGFTPLAEHAAASNPVVQRLIAGFGAGGRLAQSAPARIVTTGAGGAVDLVIVRRAVARADFPENLLATGTVGRLGRSLARFGVQAVGNERRTDVVASAGARGAARVRTVSGDIVVQPDTAAIKRLEARDVDILELERFLREIAQ